MIQISKIQCLFSAISDSAVLNYMKSLSEFHSLREHHFETFSQLHLMEIFQLTRKFLCWLLRGYAIPYTRDCNSSEKIAKTGHQQVSV